jgi:ElaB/YqjD/DUF883 family membrane-anchored ribosome-binding protein
MTHHRGHIQDGKDSLVETFKSFVDNAESVLQATKDYTANGFPEARAKFEQQLKEAKAQLSNAKDMVSSQARHAADATEHYVGENPWTSLAIAVSIGTAVGLLLRGR